MSKTIGIVGGKGRMGQAFAKSLEAQGHKILISDRRTKLSNRELAKKSDVIIVSVPIDLTEKIINEIAPHVKKGALLMDLTSVKQIPVHAMLKSKAAVIGAHPMCNETTFGPGQTMLFCPARAGKWLPWFKETFQKKGGLNLIRLTAKKQDEMMSFVQALIHFSEFALGKTLSDLNPKLTDLLPLASPISRLKIKVAARHLAQDPNLYGNIQIQNPRNPKLLKTYEKAVKDLVKIVESGDLNAFTKYFKSGTKYFSDFSKQAFQDTDDMVNQMIEVKQTENPTEFPKNGIGSLGPNLTFSSIAAETWRGKRKNKIVFFTNITAVAKAVAQGKINEAVLPIENRLQGNVRETMDVLFKKDVHIIGEFSVPIHHQMAVLPGGKKADIKNVMSHPQALSQCGKFLRKEFPNATWATSNSTAAAFDHVQKTNDKHTAAIGHLVAAKHYKFKVIGKNIENDGENETRFVVISKKPLKKVPKKPKTSIVFYFSKDKPGSLFSIFEIFNKLGVNLSHIESRPAPRKLGEYLFYLDFEGNANKGSGKKAVDAVRKIVKGMKVLGVY
ncbi:prephenate dehydratase [Candidatus Peregrinibacteria bacterium]|nr:prephenate dehydratase [Candidatus Peregrinibacteria bacterium]